MTKSSRRPKVAAETTLDEVSLCIVQLGLTPRLDLGGDADLFVMSATYYNKLVMEY